MTAEHNHQPRCCCPTYQVAPDDHDYEPRGGRIEREICPACIQHGELAPAIECPQCHQPIGRPHTDFCTLDPDRIWPAMGRGRDQDGMCNECGSTSAEQHSPRCPHHPPVDDLVGHLRNAVDRARERRTHGSQP